MTLIIRCIDCGSFPLQTQTRCAKCAERERQKAKERYERKKLLKK